MKYTLYLILFLVTPSLFAQKPKQEKLNKELKEIVEEANLLFSYRMMEWWGSELTEKQEELNKEVSDYILYHDAKNIYFVLLDDSLKHKLGTYYLPLGDTSGNVRFDSTQEKLSRKESRLYQVKHKMDVSAGKLAHEKITTKDGYSVSSILIKQKRGYKLYLMANTSEINVIPIGNDAVFQGNNRGRIKSWEWFHEELLPIPASIEGIKLATHKHEDRQALLSPTEIANFRLYGMLYNMKEMPVLSVEAGLLLEYNTLGNAVHLFQPKNKAKK